MIKETILFTTILLSSISYTSQMKVTDKTGKLLTSISEKDKDVKVSITIPQEVVNHELIQFGVTLRSKLNNSSEEYLLGIVASGECVKDIKSAALKDKKTIDLWVVKSDNTSDFSKVFYDGDVAYFHWNEVSGISARNEQFYDLEIGVFGKDITSYEYKQDNNGNTVKQPIYSFTKLSSFKMDFDGGKPANHIASRHQTFMMPKIDQNTMSLWISPPGEMPLLGNAKSYQIKARDQAIIQSERLDAQHYYVSINTLPTTNETLESLKSKIAENLARDANGYNNYQSMFHSSNRIFYPEFCVNYVTPSNSDDTDSKGMKGKLAKLKTDWNASGGGVTDEKLNAKIAYAKSSLNWQPTSIGGVNCEKIELEVYTKSELVSNSTSKLYEVKPDSEGNKRTFEVYVGQKGDYVFYVIMFKHGKDKTLNTQDLLLRNSALKEMKFN